MTHVPWDYLFRPFNSIEFPDLLTPIWVVSLILLVAQVVLYNLRTRQLHRHEPLVAMQEWLLWTGVITFSMILIEAVFAWYFLFVIVTVAVGLAAYVWVRFWRFPPIVEQYNEYLRRTRFFSQAKYKHPEATIRPSRRRRRGH
ncbi:MAG: hypothetical protein M0Z49_06120 [Chloroflexi bacterium]|nr:hypothetical protein [Chloroflexota bacterium]